MRAPGSTTPRLALWLALMPMAAGCAAPAASAPASSVAPATAAAATAASSPAPSAPAAPRALDYRFALDAGLRALSVRVCFEGAPPPRLVPGMRAARALIVRAALERGASRRELPITAQGVDLTGLEPGDCVRYELSLESERGGLGAPMLHRAGASLMANLAALLWRPADYAGYARARASFELPAGAALSVPWPRLDTGSGEPVYALDASAFAFHAYAAFGALSRRELEVAGSAIELAVLEGLTEPQVAAVERWALAQARAVAALQGRLPRARIQIVVLPVGRSAEPIRFGSMTRGGGVSVGVLLARDFDEAELVRDWVLVHELCHLLHPFVARDEAWLSEGIATYYQEVLRARAGLQPREAAWRRILSGSEQGEAMAGSLERGAAEMFETYRFAPVYWGGAAVMLLADVELRRRSGGARSLDAVLMELSRCCGGALRPWTAGEVAERIDALAGAPVLRELIERVVRGPSFPSLRALYAQLGVDGEGRPVAGAPLAAIRDAIMTAPSP